MPAVPAKDEYMQRCICGDCPSYPGDGALYCAKGRSANEVEREGCICGDCENFKDFGPSKRYYCAEGSAEEIEA